jgi:hypothetical protein
MRIEVDTAGRGGDALRKVIVVTTNDPVNANTNLVVKGMVDTVVTISPPLVRLAGSPGEALTSEVRIVPEAKYPFKIIDVLPEKGDNIQFSLKENSIANGRSEYILLVTNTTRAKGRYRDKITLKTTSPYRPEISLHVLGFIN